jgi:hypothetical protein
MMTDFLDLLEADLRSAAQRRGRRRSPVRALKLAAAAAAVALIVVGAVRVAERLGTTAEVERPATAQQLSRDKADVAVIPAGQVGAAPVIARPLVRQGYLIAGGKRTAPNDMPSEVLYRPGAEKVAAGLAKRLRLDMRPLDAGYENRLGGKLRNFDVVVIFGFDLQDRLLRNQGDCGPAGAELQLCASTESTMTAFFLGDRRIRVDSPSELGHWAWGALSPDGRTILAQWSDDCERTYTFGLDGGEPRLIAAGEALGWTTGGDAIVFVPGGCNSPHEPGVYFLTGDDFVLQVDMERRPPRLAPSVQARTYEEFKLQLD